MGSMCGYYNEYETIIYERGLACMDYYVMCGLLCVGYYVWVAMAEWIYYV